VSGRDLLEVRDWLRAGTEGLCSLADDLGDAAFVAPSALPGWTRAHVIGHLARNAEALGRLCAWAATGVETPMYSGPDQRGRDIEASATRPPARLRMEFDSSAADLEKALDGLDAAGWDASVRSALGRQIPATEIPWLRVREVWFHAVDLGVGRTVGDFPTSLVDALLDDVSTGLSTKPDVPAVRLRATDRDRCWSVGPWDAFEVEAPAAALLAWASGRGPAPVGTAPVLPSWL
jgi:maleylpyruvate isomerase